MIKILFICHGNIGLTRKAKGLLYQKVSIGIEEVLHEIKKRECMSIDKYYVTKH